MCLVISSNVQKFWRLEVWSYNWVLYIIILTYLHGKLYTLKVDLKIKMSMVYRDKDIILYEIIIYWCSLLAVGNWMFSLKKIV